MIEKLKNNPKTTIFGTLTIISEVIRANPDLINFLPDNIEGYILGAASAIFAFATAIYAKDARNPKPPKAEVIIEEEEKK